MTDTDAPRRPGPWDTVATEPDARPSEVPAEALPENKGQHPLWAIVSTGLLGGFIWWASGSWIVALAAIVGLFVHEYGHVLAMNRLGMGPAKIFIIPFLGGAARASRLPKSEWDGVLVSLAGPAFGLMAAVPFLVLYIATRESTWLLGVFTIAMLNLINLAPAPPLDGSKALGPVLARIHPMVEIAAIGLVGLIVVAWGVSNGSLIFAAFLALSLIGHLRRGRWRPEGRRLDWREAGFSVGLFVATTLACVGVALAALLPLAGGSLTDALAIGARYFEFGR